MSELQRATTARCAYSMAPKLVQRFFDRHAADHGQVRVTLHAPGLGLGLPEVAPEHEVGASLRRATLREEEYGAFAHFDIGWEPNDDRYPSFSGSLHLVPADDAYETTSITLSGTYQPPYGVAGRTFDAALGHRIAEATADVLLKEIRTELERDYDEIEERKRVARGD